MKAKDAQREINRYINEYKKAQSEREKKRWAEIIYTEIDYQRKLYLNGGIDPD